MPVIFDPEFRRSLEVLKRIVARALAGRGGAGHSPLYERGGRVEFGGHRAYVPGDDAGAIDWNAYARLETLVVKEFEAPREGQLLLVLDRSGSMQSLGKDAAALRCAAALGWLGLAAGARVACTSRGGASQWITAPARFPELLDALERTPPGGVAQLADAVRDAPGFGAGRRTVIVLSDLYEAEDAARALAVLGRRSATVVCVQVVAADELRAPAEPALLLRDAESDATLHIELSAAVRERFHHEAEAFLHDRQKLVASHGARLVRVAPHDELLATIERIVAGQETA